MGEAVHVLCMLSSWATVVESVEDDEIAARYDEVPSCARAGTAPPVNKFNNNNVNLLSNLT